MKEKLIEMNDEQPQLINEQVKRAINIIFQRLKTRIQPKKQYTGEEFLSRSLEIIKKATLKILSNDDDDNDEQSEDNIQSEDENQETEKNDEPLNGNSIDQTTLTDAISSIHNEEKHSLESEILSTNSQKNGWDTVDDFQQESNIQSTESSEQNQIVLVTEDSTSTAIQIETTSEISLIENNQSTPSSKNIEEVQDSEGTADTVEENNEIPPPPSSSEVEITKEKTPSDDGKSFSSFCFVSIFNFQIENDDEIFTSARPSVQDVAPPQPVTQSAAPTKVNLII